MNPKSQCSVCRYGKTSGDDLLCTHKKVFKQQKKQDKSNTRNNMKSTRINPDNNCQSFVEHPPKPSFLRRLFPFVLAIYLIAGILALALYINERPPSALKDLSPGIHYITDIPDVLSGKLTPKIIEKNYEQHILPLIEEMHKENKRAAQEAIRHFQDHYQYFENGVEGFVDDLGGYGSRFKTLTNGIADTVAPRSSSSGKNKSRVEEQIRKKFAHHIMTDTDLENLITETLTMYTDHVEANRNHLLSSIDLALRMGDVPLGKQIHVKLGDSFLPQVYEKMIDASMQKSVDSVVSGILSLIAGEVACVAVRSAIPLITSTVAVQGVGNVAATTLGASTLGGSASALASQILASGLGGFTSLNLAASGGTAGSFLGPVGTVGGLVAGLGAGVVVDIWLTNRFKEKATCELTKVMRSLETTIIHGKTGKSPNKGLRTIFDQANNTLFEITQTAVLETMKGAI